MDIVKTVKLVLVFTLIAFVYTASASAQDRVYDTDATRRSQDLPLRTTDRATDTARIHRTDRIRALFRKMLSRFEAAIIRLENLAGRIETKLTELQGEGHDVTRLTSDLRLANTTLTETKRLVAELSTQVDELLASDHPREIFASLKVNVRLIKSNLMEVHEVLRNIVKGIKTLEEA